MYTREKGETNHRRAKPRAIGEVRARDKDNKEIRREILGEAEDLYQKALKDTEREAGFRQLCTLRSVSSWHQNSQPTLLC